MKKRRKKMPQADLRAPKLKDSVTTMSVVPDPLYTVFRADVQPAKGGPSPTGTVTFKDGATVIRTVPVGGSWDSTTTPASVTATYNGDSQYLPSTSQTLTPPYT